MVQFDAIRFHSWQGVAAASCSARGDTEGQRSGDQGALLHFAWISMMCTPALVRARHNSIVFLTGTSERFIKGQGPVTTFVV